jgi:hypothetical protein
VSSSSFIHVLATRIGIGVYDEAWFDYRLRLFQSVTVPSIASQTSRDFSWLLVVDKNMPPVARSRFDAAIAKLDNAVVIPVEFKTDFRKAVVRWSRQKAESAGAAYVLSSRLDDDDALRTDAFERLQAETADFLRSSRHRYAVFSFNLGCMWLPSRRRGYTRYHDSHSLGLSVVEPAEVCRSVYAWPHREIKQQLAPRGTYIRGLAGDTLWWLYAAHNLSDSETGSGIRLEKIMNHRYGYPVDESILGYFGLDPAAVAALAVTDEPESNEPTKFLSLRGIETEQEIKELRARIRRTSRMQVLKLYQARRRLGQLEQQRLIVGSGIVQDKGDKSS